MNLSVRKIAAADLPAIFARLLAEGPPPERRGGWNRSADPKAARKERKARYKAKHPEALKKQRARYYAKRKQQVYDRDGMRCAYCGNEKDPLQIDHRIPRSRGGRDTLENKCVACRRCNISKGGRTPEEWWPRWYTLPGAMGSKPLPIQVPFAAGEKAQ